MDTTSPRPSPPESTGSPREGPALSRSRLRGLGAVWLPGNAASPLLWNAVTAVLMAVQVQRIDPAGKVHNLALLTGCGAVMTLLVQPLAGRLSDRTRSRWGRRSPWVLGGAVGGAVSLVLMGAAHSIGVLLPTYLLLVLTVNSAQLPMNAMMPDQVPRERRGLFASLAAVGQSLGGLAGQLIASASVADIAHGYWVVAAILVVVLVAFAVTAREPSSRDMADDPFNWTDLLRSYWVNPRRNPDFAWVFISRFLLVTGYLLTASYNLYVLQDYIGLGDRAVHYVPLLSALTFACVLALSAVGGPWSDRVGRRKPFIQASSVVFGVGLLVPLLLPTVTGMIIAAVVGGVGYGMFGSVDAAVMSEVLPSKAGYGKDLAVINLSWSIPQAFSPFLAGALVTATGGYTALFPIGAALAVMGGLSVTFAKGVR
ncbi:MFS transporter [Streptomyces sp. 8L]|uniref:MFS transporter n=1 Tax=Streptomyces sp. 8L TaxID=2877242 RepID=UPI001CD4FCAB|nr:MFS transporter [Streptomyces sp. 8L]MCA1221497.1 MFS transporter [Streptomyces sp. 8L]